MVCLISLARLRQEYYGRPADGELVVERTVKEAVHEPGHTCGLAHCDNPVCAMFLSNSLEDTDREGPDFCPSCRAQLAKPRLRSRDVRRIHPAGV